MRMTTELLASAPSYLNPLNDRELDLRGHKISAIENLGVVGPQDALDLTDNDLQTLGNFPLSTRLRMLLLARNRISTIQPTIANTIPNLTTLILTTNNISELADLDPLKGFKTLTHLSLMDNPVTRKEHYRLYVIWRVPSVRFFDYVKVKDAERVEAKKLFGHEEDPTPLAAKIMGIKSRTFDVGSSAIPGAQKNYAVRLTADEKEKLEEKIKAAKSLEDIARLEKMLREGTLGDNDVEM